MKGTPSPEEHPMPEPLLTVGYIARLFGVPVSWVYSKAEQGEIPSYKIGRYRRFVRAEIEAWLETQKQGGVRE